MKIILLFISFFSILCAKPPKEIPSELLDAYTLQGQIPVSYWYWNNTYSSKNPIIFEKKVINNLIKDAKNKKKRYYGKLDLFLFEAIETHVGNFKGKNVGILGSVTPWYEAIVLAYGGKPVTIEYNKIISTHPKVKVMTVDEYKKNPITFDYLLSISSIEHDGLGRYGDPLNPNGDLDAMKQCAQMLNEGGLFFLAIPVGPDQLVWNAHRIYGKLRLPMLLESWEIVGNVGHNEGDFLRGLNDWKHQPVFILKKSNENNH